MAKSVKVLCDRCESKVRVGIPFCNACGFPTGWASHAERVEWEVAQWRRREDPPRQGAEAKPAPALRPTVGRRRSATVTIEEALPAQELATVTTLHQEIADEAVTRIVLRALNDRVRELEARLVRIESHGRKGLRRRR